MLPQIAFVDRGVEVVGKIVVFSAKSTKHDEA